MRVTVAVNEKGIRIGQDHQNARYSDREIQHVLEMRDEGKSYGFICTVMDMPKSTVASICKATRRCQVAVEYKVIGAPKEKRVSQPNPKELSRLVKIVKEVCTSETDMFDRIRHNKAKISSDELSTLIRRFVAGETVRVLAKDYGLSESHVRGLCSGERKGLTRKANRWNSSFYYRTGE